MWRGLGTQSGCGRRVFERGFNQTQRSGREGEHVKAEKLTSRMPIAAILIIECVARGKKSGSRRRIQAGKGREPPIGGEATGMSSGCVGARKNERGGTVRGLCACHTAKRDGAWSLRLPHCQEGRCSRVPLDANADVCGCTRKHVGRSRREEARRWGARPRGEKTSEKGKFATHGLDAWQALDHPAAEGGGMAERRAVITGARERDGKHRDRC
eukprot:680613-Pleurochrysis_carterae.AAC.1